MSLRRNPDLLRLLCYELPTKVAACDFELGTALRSTVGAIAMCLECERLKNELEIERREHAATLERYRIWKGRCEDKIDEIHRLKEELLIVLGVVSESSDKLPAKEN